MHFLILSLLLKRLLKLLLNLLVSFFPVTFHKTTININDKSCDIMTPSSFDVAILPNDKEAVLTCFFYIP